MFFKNTLVMWWVWAGGEEQSNVYGHVKRVNRITCTVTNRYGDDLRIPKQDLQNVTDILEARDILEGFCK